LSIEDDVVEVNNDFVYNKFKEKVQTADNVIFKEAADGTIELLVIKRKRGPHRDLFALPGGILDVSLSKEQMIQGVVDPGAPSFRATEVHDFLMPFQSNVVLDITDNYRANEVFGAEALREALEEVDLKRKFIKNSFYLPIKYDRFDWDARAAGGVDVGGIGIIIKDVTKSDLVDGQPTTSVVEEWIPTAKDDAIAYEWIQLDDVISGEKQLAFGHVEFVRDALSTSMKKDLLNKSNKIKMLKGNSVYTYNDIAELDQRIFETSQRNSQIIKKANVVRKQNNQPLIPTENIDSIVDRKNKAFIDSIRGLRSYTSNSANPVKFTAQMQMEPDFIFSELFGDLTDQALYALDLTDSDFVGLENLIAELDDVNNLYRETGEALAADSIELSSSGKRKVKTEIKDFLSKNYKMKLKAKINQGMLIGDYIAAMANNADQIIKSKDFNLILDNLLDSGFKIEITPDGSTISVLDWGDSDLAEYVKLDDRNTIIKEMGLSTAVDDNFAYLQTAYGDDITKAMENIRNKNNRFFAKTFPPEIYIPSWDYFKDNAVGMPEALLETKKLKLTGDNRLQGMAYHGSPGLNSKGRAVNQILQNRLFSIQNTPSVERQYLNSMEGLLNKIMTENNLNWLDPTKYRGNMLRLNYMYTTSNPFLATSYAMGGFNSGEIELLNSNATDAFHTILNHTDVLDPDDVDTLNLIKEDLKRLGLSIQEQNGSLRIVDVDTGMRPQLADPGVMQIKFDVPGNAILHTDMPLTRQLKNPNVSKLLKNILNNLQVDNMLTEEIVDDLIYNLIDTMNDKQNVYLDMDDTMQSSIAEQLVAGVNDPQGKGAATRQTVRNYYALSLQNRNKLVQNKIQTLLKEGTGTLSTINDFIVDNLYADEAISQKGSDDAFRYVQRFGDNLVRPTYFVNQKNTAGHVLFTKNLNDTFADVKRINFDVAFNFANNLPIESLGGSYSATRDLLYLQRFMEVVRPDTEVFMDFIEFHKNNVGYKQIIKNMVQNKIEPTEDLLFDMANSARGYTSTNDVRVKSKYNIDLLTDVKEATKNLQNEVDDIVFANTKTVDGDRTLVNYLNRINGLPQKYVQAVPSPIAFADILLLKSLSQSGIEIVVGTGGGRTNNNNYHDVFGIVDPGDKFGTGVPRQATYVVKGVEMNQEKLSFVNDVVSGNKSLADLSDEEIKAIAEIIPIETITENEVLSQTTKERYAKIYNELDIYDTRFITAGQIDPSPLDAVFLQQNSDLKELFARQSIFGDVDDLTVKKHVDDIVKTIERQVDPKDFTRVVYSSGLASTLGNGLDMFDAAVILPVALDIVMSKRSGIGSETETIGGAVADVAGDVYDPSERDTSFEALYGSPADPDSIAGQFGAVLGAGKKALSYVFNPNGYLDNFIGDIKEVSIKALEGVRDAAGLNDWVYNVKRDMYVTQKLKQDGYGDGKKIPSGRVKELENEYETAIPNDTDRFGVPLDTSFGDYIKDSFKVNSDFKLVGDK
jgi:8-oxo-dGTP pyrophosphatase MutT (NUDIX family)